MKKLNIFCSLQDVLLWNKRKSSGDNLKFNKKLTESEWKTTLNKIPEIFCFWKIAANIFTKDTPY